MEADEKKLEKRRREELVNCLRRLAKWKANDAVKLAFLEAEELGPLEELDLMGVAELRRNANGTFEVKFVDRVKVLAMLREMLEEEQGGALVGLLGNLGQSGDGDGA